jgi:hypothetical protein
MYHLSDEMQHGGTSKFGFHIDPPDSEYYMQPSLSYYLTGFSDVVIIAWGVLYIEGT